jgi:hypothetical protein
VEFAGAFSAVDEDYSRRANLIFEKKILNKCD